MAQSFDQLPYLPDRNEYDTRMFRYAQEGPVEKILPHGFPQRLTADMAWEGGNISMNHAAGSESPYLLILQAPQLVEIDAALKHFQKLNQPMETLDPSTFPLPNLHSILRSASDNLHSGYGFTLIRGIPVERYSRQENMIIYVGISSHIAAIRGRQDHQFEGQPADVMLAHITDMRRPNEAQNFSLAAYSDGEVVYHTDVGDIVSLFVLSGPVNGGESLLASAWTVYNSLAETRPDLLRVLAEDWPIPSAKQPGLITHRPLLFYQPACDGAPERVILQFSRRSFSGFGARSQMNMLSSIQVEALDALHFLAEKFHVAMKLERGDMQFINNLSMIHARNSYIDDSENRRHLLRLWLRDPQNSWIMPEPLWNRSNLIFDEGFRRGQQVFPVDPVPRSVGKARKD
ncbi:hypothetical protein DTO013E5_1897 [Penicillium roqueforti]|uniref:Taurine catabolism dioxygenase TauD/TfdA n=1 Tax=Penicillium roqueforti (strain FM164) TaxID=1365484 RepID=W6Q6B8_PENRF|nr:hypothetical protein CBS147332_3960 [Penicillium roqueforti]CDM31865.1 Taurine catabolism dioxygenase TauD/TfdA [Penicillium roqueforti FM164]KAI2741117.1 hypothetical protein DTO012A1_4891 [Penicillium roqueforti]KAI2748737.1 hypothetical protein DTO013F2_6230 [Penicillium roqueforti]KAI2774404.1 hypothetical protein DTO012A8_1222 [Penicillium roqueforti]